MEINKEIRAQRTMHVAQKEIFAVAYCEVKLKREFCRNAPHPMKNTIAFGQAKRNKGHHLTFGYDEDKVDASSDEEDDDEKGIVLVDEDSDEPTTPHLHKPVEDLNSNQSFYWPEVGFDV